MVSYLSVILWFYAVILPVDIKKNTTVLFMIFLIIASGMERERVGISDTRIKTALMGEGGKRRSLGQFKSVHVTVILRNFAT